MKEYTWKTANRFGYVFAENIVDAVCESVKKYYGPNYKNDITRIDILVKEGHHEVY